MRTVLIVNPKGGCGKTTVAVNLAAGLAHRRHSVKLWDLDRQRSSLQWLAIRPPAAIRIERLDNKTPDGLPGKEPAGEPWVVLDTPAGLHGKNLAHALKLAQKVLVPLQPSVFDMAATRDFLAVLAEEKAIRKHRADVGVVGVRVDFRTKAAVTLVEFLKQFDLPVVATLRDTQTYANAAFNGLSVFDLPPHLGERDVQEWAPLLEWVERAS